VVVKFFQDFFKNKSASSNFQPLTHNKICHGIESREMDPINLLTGDHVDSHLVAIPENWV